jgi:hypothetical protein
LSSSLSAFSAEYSTWDNDWSERLMAATYDLSTLIGQVRLLITDTDVDNPIFQDAEITAFLTMQSNNVKLAAAQALDSIASSEVLTQKVMKTLDLQTNGAAVAKEIRAHATELRRQVTDDDAGFDVAEMVVDDFTHRRAVYNDILRTRR